MRLLAENLTRINGMSMSMAISVPKQPGYGPRRLTLVNPTVATICTELEELLAACQAETDASRRNWFAAEHEDEERQAHLYGIFRANEGVCDGIQYAINVLKGVRT